MKIPLAPEKLEKRKSLNKKILTFGCLPIFILFMIVFIIGLSSNDDKKSEQSTTKTGLADADTFKETASNPAVENWRYQENTDKMGNTLKLATAVSKDELTFEFPYHGGSQSTLTVQNRRGETNVIFGISPGQILTDKSIKIKFDNRKPYTVSGTGSEDYQSDIVFLGSTNKVIADLKKSKKAIIEISFYQEGSKQIEFDIAGLNW